VPVAKRSKKKPTGGGSNTIGPNARCPLTILQKKKKKVEGGAVAAGVLTGNRTRLSPVEKKMRKVVLHQWGQCGNSVGGGGWSTWGSGHGKRGLSRAKVGVLFFEWQDVEAAPAGQGSQDVCMKEPELARCRRTIMHLGHLGKRSGLT